MNDDADDFVDDLAIDAELLGGDERHYSMRLGAGTGAVRLEVTRRPGSAVSEGRFEADEPESGARFWRHVAQWLRQPVPQGTHLAADPGVAVRVLSMGRLQLGDGKSWVGLKLFIGDEADPAELYLNVDAENDRGQLKEKDVSYRADLVAWLRRALGDVAGLPALEVAPLPPKPARASAPEPVVGLEVGEVLDHAFGRCTVTAIRTLELDGVQTRMAELRLDSGARLMLPVAAAARLDRLK